MRVAAGRGPELQGAGAIFFNRVRDSLLERTSSRAVMGVEDLHYMGRLHPDWQARRPEALRERGVNYAEWDAKYGRADGPVGRGRAPPVSKAAPRIRHHSQRASIAQFICRRHF